MKNETDKWLWVNHLADGMQADLEEFRLVTAADVIQRNQNKERLHSDTSIVDKSR